MQSKFLVTDEKSLRRCFHCQEEYTDLPHDCKSGVLPENRFSYEPSLSFKVQMDDEIAAEVTEDYAQVYVTEVDGSGNIVSITVTR